MVKEAHGRIKKSKTGRFFLRLTKQFLYDHAKGKVINLISTEKTSNQEAVVNTGSAVPDDIIDTLARCLFPKVQAYFDSPEGQAEFEEWKREHGNA